MKLLQPHPDYMHRAEPTAEARAIEVFAKIIRRDRGSEGDHDGRFKQKACKELAWIYHVCDPGSPYFQVSQEYREEVVTKAIFKEEPDWKPDEVVQEGLETYQEIITSPSIRLLKSAMRSIDELEKYFNNVNFEKGENKEVHDPKDVISNLEKLGKLVTSLRELKEQVEKEQTSDSETYGGYQLNEFNQ